MADVKNAKLLSLQGFWADRGATSLEWLVAACWLALLLIVSILVVLHPSRSIFDVYRDSAHHWWAAQPLYGPGMRSFVYLTSATLIFSPFVLLGQPFDDLAWRLFSVAVFLFGTWRLLRVALGERARPVMAVLLLLLLPCAGVDVQRGQAELAMAGWMFLGAANVAEGRRWRAALWLCLAVALKPLALVPLLLYGALRPDLRLPLALGLGAVLLAPFAHPDTPYVLRQDRAMLAQVFTASQPVVWRFDEVGNMLRRFGVECSGPMLTWLRGVAGLVTLALAGLLQRRVSRERSAFIILALAVCYLMVFNPRTELGSYVDLAVIVGLFMGESWPAHRATAVALGLLILAFGTQAYGNWIFRPTETWLKPLLAILFYGFVVWWCVSAGCPTQRRRITSAPGYPTNLPR